MFLLLIAAATIYSTLGDVREAIVLGISIMEGRGTDVAREASDAARRTVVAATGQTSPFSR
jgi:hypothetical protein